MEKQKTTDFGWALTQWRAGQHVTRRAYEGMGFWIRLDHLADGSTVFVQESKANTTPTRYFPTTEDVLATDWFVA